MTVLDDNRNYVLKLVDFVINPHVLNDSEGATKRHSIHSIYPLSRLLLLSHPPRILEVEPLEAPPPKHEERLEGLRERSDIPHDLVLRVAIEVFQQRLSTGIRPCAASAISTPGARRRLLMCCAISQLQTCFDNNASSNVADLPMCTTCTCNEC